MMSTFGLGISRNRVWRKVGKVGVNMNAKGLLLGSCSKFKLEVAVKYLSQNNRYIYMSMTR